LCRLDSCSCALLGDEIQSYAHREAKDSHQVDTANKAQHKENEYEPFEELVLDHDCGCETAD